MYQRGAVASYLKSGVWFPHQKYFNASARSYPDTAALGSRILVVSAGQVEVKDLTFDYLAFSRLSRTAHVTYLGALVTYVLP